MSAFNTAMIDFSFGSENIVLTLLVVGGVLLVFLLFLLMFVKRYFILIFYVFYGMFVSVSMYTLATPFSNSEQVQHYAKYGKAFNQELEQCVNMELKNEKHINECFKLKVKQKKETMLRQDNANPETIKREELEKAK